jgi:hypothetical protein
MKPLSVLIFDTNVVFARRVGEFIEAHVLGARVSYAQNCAVLKGRLAKNWFDLILADPGTAFDPSVASSLLEEVQHELKTIVIVWTFMSSEARTSFTDKFKHVAKPTMPLAENNFNLEQLMLTA